jgi:hypothetical protein
MKAVIAIGKRERVQLNGLKARITQRAFVPLVSEDTVIGIDQVAVAA